MKVVLDYSKLFFSKSTLPPNEWLSIPKDVWKLIVIQLVGKSKEIGYWARKDVVNLRMVCMYFANLIDPQFILKIILLNPDASKYQYLCGYCRSGSLQKWVNSCKCCYMSCIINRFYKMDNLKKRLKWCYDEYLDEFKDGRPRNWFRFTIVKNVPIVHKEQPLLQISEPYLCKKYEREYHPRMNRRSAKFWKRNGNRKIINRVDCTVGCECLECVEEPEKFEEYLHYDYSDSD